jgi:uncharacterized protein involved in exopolysaccharide biosynthesis/Mrp family chromosome partitioning ATPase
MVEVGDVWRILWRRRKWILASVAILTVGTLLYTLVTPSIYSATVQVLVDPHDRQVVGNGINPSTVAADSGLTQAETQVSVIQSAGVLLRAIAATNLTKDPEFNSIGITRRLTGLVDKLLGDAPPQPTKNEAEEKTLSALRRHVTAKRADKVLVINLAVTARNPNKAAQIANAIGEAYLADQANARAVAARKISNELSARLAEQRKRVLDAAAAVEHYRAEHDMVVATGQLVSERQLAEVNSQLTAAQNRTAELKAQIEQIDRQRSGGAPADATPEVMRSALISKLREQEAGLVEREAALASQVGPRYPALTAVRSQLRNVRRLIDKELNRIAKAAQANYSGAMASQRALSTKLETLKRQTLSVDRASVHLKELQRDLDAVRSVYANYLVRAQETREQANVNSTDARIITHALPPLKRSWPPTRLLLAGALFAGAGLGAGIALLAESLAPTLLSVRQAQTMTGAPAIGILPPEAKRARRRRWLGRRPKSARGAADGEDDDQDQDSASHIDAAAGLALRRLFDAGVRPQERAFVRSVLVTSGRTDAAERDRVAHLLAAVAAKLGERVLLVDADLAGNQQSPAAGLMDVLRGERSFESVVYFEAAGEVAFVPKGRRQSTAKGAVEEVFARRMLIEARRQFDLVVINGGAAAENLVAAPLVAAVDEVLMIATLNATPVQDVMTATQALSIMGCSATAVLLVDSIARG